MPDERREFESEEERLRFTRGQNLAGNQPRLRTVIGVCLDESGSMGARDRDGADKREATIRAFNDYLASQQAVTADVCLMAVVRFNARARVTQQAVDVTHVRPLTAATYHPNGGTALFDALARCVSEAEATPADRYVVVVVTDGEENESKETTLEQVRALIAAKEALGNWTFVYLSADADAFTNAARYGFGQGNTMVFAGSAAGTYTAGASLTAATSSYRNSSAVRSASFYDVGDAVTSGGAPTIVSTTEPPKDTP